MATQLAIDADNKKGYSGNRYDWDSISAEYVQGYFITDPETGIRRHLYPTLEELAEKYGCNYNTIRQKSNQDKWTARRNVFKAKIKEHITDRQVSTFLSESAQIDALTLDKAKKLHKLLDYSLRKYENILDSDFHVSYDEDCSVDLKELESMTKMISSIHSLVRNVVGEPISTNDKQALIQDLTALNPALTQSDNKARKTKIKELQAKLELSQSQKKGLIKIAEE